MRNQTDDRTQGIGPSWLMEEEHASLCGGSVRSIFSSGSDHKPADSEHSTKPLQALRSLMQQKHQTTSSNSRKYIITMVMKQKQTEAA